ncbi:beta-glucan synthesis-associated [Auricularia subglabra TFB-10046 SS5]|nr:beta-glucan synthesis-associated [Auricularia subglabra TFB-10046 SS5]
MSRHPQYYGQPLPPSKDDLSPRPLSRDRETSESSYLLSATTMPAMATPKRFSHGSSFSTAMSLRDSKYPSSMDLMPTIGRSGLLAPYAAYDPAENNHGRDPDDALHDPDPPGYSERRSAVSPRGIANLLTVVVVLSGVIGLFVAFPIVQFMATDAVRLAIGNNVQINGTGQAAVLANIPKLVDPETPDAAKSRTGYDGQEYILVFSDEFNTDNRTFYPGDDPFWEAVDLWYGATRDLEWYDPDQATTGDGYLRLKLEMVTDPSLNHQLTMKSGMVQTWNKFCFTSGYIEILAQLPGAPTTAGYWPGAWLMGNLGRAGYGASTDGLWPYTYDSCDVGTLANQTSVDGSGPAVNFNVPPPYGRDTYNYELSWLPGQRLSACTCSDEDHPGPRVDGKSRFRGRGAPEIDILEAEKCKHRGDDAHGCVSQSVQFAPFNDQYAYDNLPPSFVLQTPDKTAPNDYRGSALQQAVSCLTNVSDTTYATGGGYGVFGFEFYADPNDPSQSFITWVSDGQPSYTVTGAAVGPDLATGVGQRLIAPEPMSIVLNLAVSESFQTVDLAAMTFPAEFLIDYVRVYQRKGSPDSAVGCDPDDYPTSDYIAQHINAYTNPNLTSWKDAGYKFPRNTMVQGQLLDMMTKINATGKVPLSAATARLLV